jgi:tetratricopeptide (TPR) repeat protein
MMHFVLMVALSQLNPTPGVPGTPTGKKPAVPKASELVKLYFLAGDLPTAIDWAKKGMKKEPKICSAQIKQLAEYHYLAGKIDELVPEEAVKMIALNKQIAPGGVSKLTEKVLEKFATRPLKLAQLRLAAGDKKFAKETAEQVLQVDPQNADAKTMLEAAK